jgi:hypothetical protein
MPPYFYDQAAEAAEKAFFLHDKCRADWEKTIDPEAIAKAWAAEVCDTHPEAEKVRGLLEQQLERALAVLSNDDEVAALGSRLGANLSWEAWQDNWWTQYRGEDGNAH